MMRKAIYALAAMALAACTQQTNSLPQHNDDTPAELPQVSFSADSAYYYTVAQVACGPRVPGSEAHNACVSFLTEKMKQLGAEVTIQESTGSKYDGTPQPVRNIICSYRPERAKRIMLCAHYDSRPFADQDEDPMRRDQPIDGANDGASAVGVLMEIGRQLQMNQPRVGVDIIFFDAEDGGTPDHITPDRYRPDTWCVGSQIWANSTMGRDAQHRYGILLDMVGSVDAVFPIELYSKSHATEVVNKVWGVAERLGYASTFPREDGGYITDDHYYVNKGTGIPVVDIIHYDAASSKGFAHYWHTHKDVLENVSRESLGIVGKVVLTVVMAEK